MKKKTIAVIGGGASGFFAAIKAAEVAKELGKPCEVHILDSAPRFLSKVKISGGGRCNVTHHQFDPALFCQNYPRGKRELRSLFARFQAKDTVEWFAAKGVKLVAEGDGRMFPSTNSSETVIRCFVETAEKLGIHLRARCGVRSIQKCDDGKFRLEIKDSAPLIADEVLVATGSAKAGYELAKSLGHTITELAPSLFSFKIQHALLKGMAGTSFPWVQATLKAGGKKFSQSGPLLITHHGLSGPAILKLSAWAAREMKRDNYQAKLQINWSGLESLEKVRASYERLMSERAQANLKNANPSFFTKRFWATVLEVLSLNPEKRWAEVGKKDLNKLTELSFAQTLDVEGQNRFKEEFVECGGVKLSEIDLKTMESKICPGLRFAGEILDIDGVTGGFNFQNAWTTGYIAGSCMAKAPSRR